MTSPPCSAFTAPTPRRGRRANTYGFGNNSDPAYAIANANQQVVFCIWDAGGSDTLDVSGYATAQIVDLRQGAFSSVGALTKNVSIAIGTVIENARTGAGNDAIYGNSSANNLSSGDGNDQIFGLGGNDLLNGGYHFDPSTGALATIPSTTASTTAPPTSTSTGGRVGFPGFAPGTIDTLVSIENAYTGGGADTLTGTGGANILSGGNGNDQIFGLGGNDALFRRL